MLRREDMWTLTDLYRSVRLQGKHPVHAINDPDLNVQFLAWEVLAPTGATDFWRRCYEMTPRYDPGFSGFMEWREIADRPATEEEALAVLKGVIEGHIARLEEMIGLHEEVAGKEAFELADTASYDSGPEAEKLRKQRAVKSRELRQTIELILKVQAAREKQDSREGEAHAERGTTPDDPPRRAKEKEMRSGSRKPSPQRARRARRGRPEGMAVTRSKPMSGSEWMGRGTKPGEAGGAEAKRRRPVGTVRAWASSPVPCRKKNDWRTKPGSRRGGSSWNGEFSS
jgi:hypothetical protein